MVAEDAEGEKQQQEITDKRLHEVNASSNTTDSTENQELEESIHGLDRTEQSSKSLQQPRKQWCERSRSFISLENPDPELSKDSTIIVERIEENDTSNRQLNEDSCKNVAEPIASKDQIIQDYISNDQTEVVTAETDNDDVIRTQSFIITPIEVRAEIVPPNLQRIHQDISPPGVITQQPRPERSFEANAMGVEPAAQVNTNQSTDQTQIQPYVQPPSYTSVEINQPNIPFIAPVPPPSYGEAMGIDHLASPRPPPLILNVATSIWTHRAQPAYCRNCHAVVISKIKHKPCTFTHLAAGLLFLFMCWPFCILPYCINYCQQARHHCPGCNQVLGVYNPVV